MGIPHETLISIAEGAAPHLDGQWRFNALLTAKRSSGWPKVAVITDMTLVGRAVELRQDVVQPERIAIFGDLVNISGQNYRSKKKISVAPTRTGRSIAGDINRRLLAAYFEEWNILMDQNASLLERNTQFLQKLNLIQSLLPSLSAEQGRYMLETNRFRFQSADDVHGQISMYKTHPRVRLEVSLDFDKLLKLAAAIQAL